MEKLLVVKLVLYYLDLCKFDAILGYNVAKLILFAIAIWRYAFYVSIVNILQKY